MVLDCRKTFPRRCKTLLRHWSSRLEVIVRGLITTTPESSWSLVRGSKNHTLASFSVYAICQRRGLDAAVIACSSPRCRLSVDQGCTSSRHDARNAQRAAYVQEEQRRVEVVSGSICGVPFSAAGTTASFLPPSP